jgi:Superfamily II DNA and RNA helicases
VENISNAGTVFVCLLKGKSGSNELKKIVIKPVYSDIAYERMKRGLKSFKTLQENIKNVILGYEVTLPPFDDPDISEFSVKNLPKLNVFQNDAVRKALTSSLTLIQGPPGTGKTVTTASIVYHLSKQLNKPSQYDLTIKKIEELESQINDILNKKFALKQEIKLRETLMIRILEKEQNNENLKNRLENYVSELNKALDSYTKEAENLNEKLNQSQFKLKNLKPDDSKKIYSCLCAFKRGC